MTECSHPELGRMLHHYELGMLAEDKRRAFEEHLFECDYCFEAAKQSRDVADILSQDVEIREAVRDVAREHAEPETDRQTAISPAPRRIVLKRYWPLAAAAALFLVFMLSDWQLELRPSKEAVAHLDRLAVMYFENVADPSDSLRTGEIITNLLITDLSESQYMGVVSSQRLHDILKFFGRENEKQVDRDVATEVAIRADARWILIGSILQMEPHIEITSRLIDVESGSIIASQKMSGDEGEDVFNVVDRLTVAIKTELPLPPAAFQEPDRPIAELTTSSTDAYRSYLEARERFRTGRVNSVLEHLYRAIEYDSTFAMAYAEAARITKGNQRALMVEKALQYSDHMSTSEKLYLGFVQQEMAHHYDSAAVLLEQRLQRVPQDKEAYLDLGFLKMNKLRQHQEAATYFKKVVELDPLSHNGYNGLALAYARAKQLDSAIWAIDRCLELSPGEPNYLDTRGDIYADAGRLEEAAASYRSAIRIDSTFYLSIDKLGQVHLARREYQTVDSLLRRLASSPDSRWRAGARAALAELEIHRGRFDEARNRLDLGIQVDSMELGDTWPAYRWFKYNMRFAVNWLLLQDTIAAASDAEILGRLARRADSSGPGYELWLAIAQMHMAILNGWKGDDFAARQVLENMHAGVDTLSSIEVALYHLSCGLAHYELANYDSALSHLDAMPGHLRKGTRDWLRGRTYVRMNRFDAAIPSLSAVSAPAALVGLDYRTWTLESVSSLYYLALAHEGAGHIGDAISTYERFLDHWGECTPMIDMVRDAKRRLANLKSGGV